MSDSPDASLPVLATENSSTQVNQTMNIPMGQTVQGVAMVEHSYVRIQGRIMNETGKQNPSNWIAGAFMSFGISATAFLGLWALPANAQHLHSGTRPVMVTVGIAAAVVGAVCLLAQKSIKRDAKQIAKSICDEMDAWANRK